MVFSKLLLNQYKRCSRLYSNHIEITTHLNSALSKYANVEEECKDNVDPCAEAKERLKQKKKVCEGVTVKGPKVKPKYKTFQIYRYNPNESAKPHMQSYTIDLNTAGIKVLDALISIRKNHDPTLAYRMSCREGICGSCGMNIDGKNGLACLAPISKSGITKIYPLPHMYVVKDLVVDFKQFLNQHARIMPYLIRNEEPTFDKQFLQSSKDRGKLNGTVECILCACCSTSCPEYWWHGHTKNGKDFLGPAALLNAYRWIQDSRDEGTQERLDMLKNYYNVYRCHTINNCTSVCPKRLNPASAIANLRLMLANCKKKKKPEMANAVPAEPEKACENACK